MEEQKTSTFPAKCLEKTTIIWVSIGRTTAKKHLSNHNQLSKNCLVFCLTCKSQSFDLSRNFGSHQSCDSQTSARNGVNLATAWHRLAKFSQASPRGKTRGSRGNRQDEQDEQDVQVQTWDFQEIFFLSFLLLGVRTWELENYGKVHGSFPVAWTVNCNLQLHFAQPWTIHFNFLWPFSPSFGFFVC